MNDAANTWALVVGIDSYEDPNVPDLEGAVADAVAFVDWLGRLGVPDAQILVHGSPSKRSRSLLRGRGALPAGAADLNKSIVRLERVRTGTRLVVYLAGHGLYEPEAGRLFLLPDFSSETPTNMGLALFIQRFLAMPFRRQFLFVDGCQNLPYAESERSKIKGEMYGGRTGFTPRRGNVLIGCYAAALGELAQEVNGRGAFTTRLLEAVDLEKPFEDAVALDFSTGQRWLDLRKVLTEWVAPYVREDVQGNSQQTPNLQAHPAETSDDCRFFALRDEMPAGKVTVVIRPEEAVAVVDRLRISVLDQSLWSFSQPRPPARKVGVPIEVHVPTGHPLTAHCVLRKGAPWSGTLEHRCQVADENQLSFDLERTDAGAAPAVEVRTVDAAGGVVANQFSYDLAGAADLAKGARGVRLEHHETGPVFRIPRAGAGGRLDAARLATWWAKAIVKATPEHVGTATITSGKPGLNLRPRVRLDLAAGGAVGLAGPIATRDLVWIGFPEDAPAEPLFESSVGQGPAGARSLASLEHNPLVEVEPGHILTRVDLPWGSWSEVRDVPRLGAERIKLPASVGEPPLRVRLFSELRRPGSHLFGVKGRVPAVTLQDGLWGERSVEFRGARPRSARWALAAPRVAWLRRDDAVGVATTRGYAFPFVHGRSHGLERTRHGLLVEPLSAVPSSAWDLLLAQGLLDALPLQNVVELTYAKWEDPLLGLAGAYAVYARPPDERTDPHLATVLRNLTRLADRRVSGRLPDIDLLRAALSDRRGRKLTRTDQSSLEGWAVRGAVPVLRWGVPLAIRLVEERVLAGEAFDRWLDELRSIEETLSPACVWTVWRRSRRAG